VAIGSSITGHLNSKEAEIAPEWAATYNKGFSVKQQKEVIEQITYADIFRHLKWI